MTDHVNWAQSCLTTGYLLILAPDNITCLVRIAPVLLRGDQKNAQLLFKLCHFIQQLKETLQGKYHEPEHKVGSLVIDESTSLVDSGTVGFVIMPQIHAANCAAALSVMFRNYSVYE